eukprot:Pgem_evm1s5135
MYSIISFTTAIISISLALTNISNANQVNFTAPNKLFLTNSTNNQITSNTTSFSTTNGPANGPGGGLNIQAGRYDGPPALAQGDGNWPVIDGMQFSVVSFIVNRCGLVAPHIHSNGHEFNTIIQGQGIVGSFGVNDGKWTFSQVSVGDSFVFPKGSIHMWINTGEEQLVTVGGFTTSLPTTAVVGVALVDLEVIAKSALDTELFPKLNETECYDAIKGLMELV